MYQSLILSAAPLLSLPGLAGSNQAASDSVCSVKNPDVCAHLGLSSDLKTTEEGQFIVDLVVPAGAAAPANLKVVLWMPDMGHGSSPVTLQNLGGNQYKVTSAWFLMAGTWLVKLNFDFNGQNLQIEIPVEIAE